MREYTTRIAELIIDIHIDENGRVGADVYGPDGRNADIKINFYKKPVEDLSNEEIYCTGQWVDCKIIENE